MEDWDELRLALGGASGHPVTLNGQYRRHSGHWGDRLGRLEGASSSDTGSSGLLFLSLLFFFLNSLH